MRTRPLAVEQWMNERETRCARNPAETRVDSLTVAALLELTSVRDTFLDPLLPLELTDGAIEGSGRLRNSIAPLYATQPRHAWR